MAEEKKKKKGHKFHRTHIEHFKDGSGTVEHHHEEGAHKNVKHAVGNIDEMHDSVEDHLGAPNAGEAEADGGDHGIRSRTRRTSRHSGSNSGASS